MCLCCTCVSLLHLRRWSNIRRRLLAVQGGSGRIIRWPGRCRCHAFGRVGLREGVVVCLEAGRGRRRAVSTCKRITILA